MTQFDGRVVAEEHLTNGLDEFVPDIWGATRPALSAGACVLDHVDRATSPVDARHEPGSPRQDEEPRLTISQPARHGQRRDAAEVATAKEHLHLWVSGEHGEQIHEVAAAKVPFGLLTDEEHPRIFI